MKNFLSIVVGICLLATLPATAVTVQPSEPSIMSIRGRIVRIRVPAGFDRVTLQQYVLPRGNVRSRPTDRWRTLATKYPRGSDTVITLRLPTLISKRFLRVFGNKLDPIPGSLLTGITSFLPDPPEPDPVLSGNQAIGGNTNLSPSDAGNLTAGDSAARSVEESDIWKVQGTRLYFFNELRGLQVFDLSNAAAPALLGTLRLPGAGEEMYLMGNTHAVLLKRSTANFWPVNYFVGGGILTPVRAGSLLAMNDASASSSSANRIAVPPLGNGGESGEIVVADVRAGAPKEVARVPYEGSLAESRMVGSVLYLATNVQHAATDTTAAEWGTQITSFDLADPAAPVRRDSVFLGGWANAVTATDRFFLVAKYAEFSGAWSHNTIDLIDISAPNGAMKRAGQATVEGNIAGKFDMNIDGDVLTAVAQVWGPFFDSATIDLVFRPSVFTKLQTFSIADPNAPVALGSLVIAPGETERATRFDAGRAYVVTFRQIDPLFVVDLKDPKNPTISGHVEADGFSTYIEPLGDRLVTIGLVEWQPAVSLFDVSDPAVPKLLSQIKLGTAKGWSSSEAVWNEKAFKVIPEKNLILVPVSASDENQGWFSSVQLVDLLPDSLVKRGAIQHEFSPRRATLVNGNVVAISQSRLVTVDAANRDNPIVIADLEIARSVNRVFNVGRYLVQLGGSVDWNDHRAPTLTVSPSGNTDETLTTIELANLPVRGATVKDSVLYLAQGENGYYDETNNASGGQPLNVSAYDLASLPALHLIGTASAKTRLEYGDLTALWPSPGILVWAGSGSGSHWRGPFWFYSHSSRLVAFDFTRPQTPKFLSEIKAGAAQPWDLSEPFEANGVVYFSYKYFGDLIPADDVTASIAAPARVPKSAARTSRHFLLRVDYGDPVAPVIDDTQINLPGQLAGVARGGTLLFTVGQNYDLATGAPKTGESALHVSAFDGAAAHLIDTLPLASRHEPVSIQGETIFALDGQAARLWSWGALNSAGGLSGANMIVDGFWGGGSWTENPKKSQLSAWRLDEAGKFHKLGGIEAEHDTALFVFGSLVVTQSDDRTLHLFDASDATKLENIGSFEFSGWVWPDLLHADGGLDTGFWTPLGAYGVETVAAPPAAR